MVLICSKCEARLQLDEAHQTLILSKTARFLNARSPHRYSDQTLIIRAPFLPVRARRRD